MDDIRDNTKTGLSLDRFGLKAVAAAAMTIDHLGYYFIRMKDAPVLFIAMRCIGRLTAPLMCFFLAEGFAHTSSRPRYALRLALFAVISQAPYSYLHYGAFSLKRFSMIATLLVSLLTLCAWEYIKPPYLKIPAVLALIAVCWRFCEWSFYAPIWALVFHIFRDSRAKQAVGFTSVSVLMLGGIAVRSFLRNGSWTNFIQLSVLLIVPLILLYNGRKGPGGAAVKYFFYVYYPLHLAVIYLILKYVL